MSSANDCDSGSIAPTKNRFSCASSGKPELGAAGIRVNALAPGVTRTGMTSAVSDDLLRAVPLGRIAEPDEIAAAAVWLCSPQASYVTGAVLVADGGWLAG